MNIGVSGPYGYVPQKLPIKQKRPWPWAKLLQAGVGGGWDALQWLTAAAV